MWATEHKASPLHPLRAVHQQRAAVHLLDADTEERLAASHTTVATSDVGYSGCQCQARSPSDLQAMPRTVVAALGCAPAASSSRAMLAFPRHAARRSGVQPFCED